MGVERPSAENFTMRRWQRRHGVGRCRLSVPSAAQRNHRDVAAEALEVVEVFRHEPHDSVHQHGGHEVCVVVLLAAAGDLGQERHQSVGCTRIFGTEGRALAKGRQI